MLLKQATMVYWNRWTAADECEELKEAVWLVSIQAMLRGSCSYEVLCGQRNLVVLPLLTGDEELDAIEMSKVSERDSVSVTVPFWPKAIFTQDEKIRMRSAIVAAQRARLPTFNKFGGEGRQQLARAQCRQSPRVPTRSEFLMHECSTGQRCQADQRWLLYWIQRIPSQRWYTASTLRIFSKEELQS